jgi:hypothetical protein
MKFETIEAFATLYEQLYKKILDPAIEKDALEAAIESDSFYAENGLEIDSLEFLCARLAYQTKKEYLTLELERNGKASLNTEVLIEMIKRKINQVDNKADKASNEPYQKLLKEIDTLIEESTMPTIYLFEKKEKNE